MNYFESGEKLNEVINSLAIKEGSAPDYFEVTDVINGSASPYELTLAEIGKLYEETRKVLSGETKREDFATSVKEALDEDYKEHAEDIAGAIDEGIFDKMKRGVGGGERQPETSRNVELNQNIRKPEAPEKEPAPEIAPPKNIEIEQYHSPETEPQKTDEAELNRDEVLRGIESPLGRDDNAPAPENLPTGTALDQKLSSNSRPVASPPTSPVPDYQGDDPYREPPE